MEVRTYDILNAGPKNRFMVNGKIVSNSGAGLQPQNLPRPSMHNSIFHDSKDEYEITEDDLSLLSSGDVGLIKEFWKNPMVLASDSIRSMIVADKGKIFYCADFSAIEGRCLAWLAGEEHILEAYIKGLDSYKIAASSIFKVPYEQITGTQRQVGKTAELACLGKDTLVFTDNGLKKIIDVTIYDRLWDGYKWVNHDGVIFKGYRNVVDFLGVEITEDHLIKVGDKWKETKKVECKESMIYRALETGLENSPYGALIEKSVEHEQKTKSQNYVPVFDIMNSGNLNCFSILTNSGPIIVHNCGFGGGYGAMCRFGADKMGIDEEEGREIVKEWRKSRPKTTKLWYGYDSAAVNAVQHEGGVFTYRGTLFKKVNNFLCIKLPSNRVLFYPYPKLEKVYLPWEDEHGNPATKFGVTTMCTLQGGGVVRQPLNFIKITENVTQAVSRDVLKEAIFRLEKAGYKTVMHIHDEVVAEVDEGFGSLEEFETIMSEVPKWAEGFPIKAKGWVGKRYRK